MSERVIRKGDYYGGDLKVWLTPDRFTQQDAIIIEWRAWGDYGSAVIIFSIDEAHLLMRSLAQLLHEHHESAPPTTEGATDAH